MAVWRSGGDEGVGQVCWCIFFPNGDDASSGTRNTQMERILLPYFKNGAVGSSFFHFQNAPYPPFHMLKISSLKKTSLPSLYSPPKTHFLHHAQNFPFPYLNTTLIPVHIHAEFSSFHFLKPTLIIFLLQRSVYSLESQ